LDWDIVRIWVRNMWRIWIDWDDVSLLKVLNESMEVWEIETAASVVAALVVRQQGTESDW
jgi:hypothetical protein